MDKAARGRTTIAIAHRLSSECFLLPPFNSPRPSIRRYQPLTDCHLSPPSAISRADEIYVVREGVIAEKGDHRSLMAKGGLYAELVNLQELQKAERGV